MTPIKIYNFMHCFYLGVGIGEEGLYRSTIGPNIINLMNETTLIFINDT